MEVALRGRLAVTLLFCINGFVSGSWAVQITQLISRFHITDRVIGHLILIVGFGALFMMPLSGLLISKYGLQRFVRIFAIAASVALIPIGLISNLYLLIPALFFLGAMIGAMDVSMNSNAVVVEKVLSRAILSSCHCFWSLGLFLAGLFGGYLVEKFGFLIHSVLISIISLVITLLVCPFIFKEAPVKTNQTNSKKRLPRSYKIYVIGIMALLAMIPECSVVDWSARYLIKDLNATTKTASLAFACFAITMAIFRLMGDVIRNRFSTVFVVRTSSMLAAIGFFVAAMVSHPYYAIIAFAVVGIGIANLVPIAFSAAGNQPDIPTSTGMSIVTSIGYLGTLMAPAPIGYVAELIGFPIVYITMSVMLGVIFILAPLIKKSQ